MEIQLLQSCLATNNVKTIDYRVTPGREMVEISYVLFLPRLQSNFFITNIFNYRVISYKTLKNLFLNSCDPVQHSELL